MIRIRGFAYPKLISEMEDVISSTSTTAYQQCVLLALGWLMTHFQAHFGEPKK